MRDGKLYSAVIQLQAAPENPPRDLRTLKGDSPLSGLTVLNLSPAVADELSYSGDPKGVIISDVSDGSPADNAGFQKGDVVLVVNGINIDSTKSLSDAAAATSRTWDLTIRRGGQKIRQRFSG